MHNHSESSHLSRLLRLKLAALNIEVRPGS